MPVFTHEIRKQPMRKTLHAIIIASVLVACQRQIDPPTSQPTPNTITTPAQGTTDTVVCTPFAQHILVQLDAWHADSALLQLPCSYNVKANTEKYPLLIFLNGTGESAKHGNLKKLKKWGPPHYMLDSMRFEFKVAGKMQPMIVVCPQSETGYRSPLTTNQVIDFMIAKYRVDASRIYLTGLSAGAQSLLRYLTQKPEYAARIAAAVPMSTIKLDSTSRSHLYYINNAHVPLNWFCGDKDETYLKANEAYAAAINAVTPNLVQFRTYDGAHNNWNAMYKPTHKYYKPNIYEWMLQYSK